MYQALGTARSDDNTKSSLRVIFYLAFSVSSHKQGRGIEQMREVFYENPTHHTQAPTTIYYVRLLRHRAIAHA